MAASDSPEGARVQALLQLLEKNQANPLMRDVQGTLEFDVTDVGQWQMKVDRGTVRVTEGAQERPDCVLATDPEEFVRIMRGDDNLVAAMLRGAVQFSGNLSMANTFRRMVPIHV
jgi:putative sterol carrier protein